MKTKKTVLTFLFAALLAANTYSQENTVSPEWKKIAYSETGSMYVNDMAMDPFNDVYIGVTGPSPTGGTDAQVIKYNSFGVYLWQWTLTNEGQYDYFKAIDVDAQGNVYAAIKSHESTYDAKWAIAKLNTQGVPQWIKQVFADSTGTGTEPADIKFYQGNVYIIGSVANDAVLTSGWVLMKLDPAGNLVSYTTYYRNNFWGFRSTAYPVEMAINPNNGDIFVGGWSEDIGGNGQYETMKYNSSCALQWRRSYSFFGPGNIENKITGIDYDNAGYVVVTGRGYVAPGDYDWFTVQYNSSGTQQWVHRKNAPGAVDDTPSDLITDGLGNVLVTGYITDVTDKNMHTMKIYGASGTTAWEDSYNSPTNGNDMGIALTIGPNNEVFVTGNIGPLSAGGNQDVGLIKYNTNGQKLYFKRYNGGYEDRAVDIEVYQLQGKSNIYVAMSNQDNEGYYRFEANCIKYSGPGATVTLPVISPGTFNFNVSGINTGIRLILNQFNGTGSITSNLFRNFPINNLFNGPIPAYLSNYRWLIEQNGLSNIQGTLEVVLSQLANHGITNGNAISIFQRVLDGSGAFTQLTTSFLNNVLSAPITGFSEFILGSDTDPILVQEQTTSVPKEFSLHQNYPNPFNPVTKIRFEIAKPSQTKIIVYDVRGREVGTLFDEYLNPGTYSINFDGTNLSSGTYFYKFTGEGFSETKKMILIK